MKRKLCVASCMVAVLLLSAMAGAQTVTVTDMSGRSVTTPADPRRIVCIGPGALRLIVYLQAEDRVVGVEDMEKANPGGRPYWLAHPELANLPRCGPGGPSGINKKPDLEALLYLAPEVIFITYMEEDLADEVEKTLGIPVVVMTYGEFATFDEAVLESIRMAGKVLGREERAGDVVAFINELRGDLMRRGETMAEEKRSGVYVGGIGYRGAYGIESTEQHYIPFDWVGVKNLAEQVQATVGSHVFMDKEMLLKLNPEVIFIDGGGLALTREDYRKKTEYYHALSAFEAKRVYVLHPFNWYTTNIGTALSDAYAIGKILFSENYGDVDVEKKADEIYAFLVGAPVYLKMKEDYGRIGQMAPFIK